MPYQPALQPATSRHTLLIILTLGILTAMGSISIDIYLPAFGPMARYFGVPFVRIENTVTVFLFGMALGQLFTGPLSDAWGRSRPLKAGLLIYILCAVAGMLTSSFELFLVFRFVQGLAGGSCQVISRALVNDLYADRKAAHVFTLLQTIMGISPILAPMLGGLLAEDQTWKYLFLVMALLSGLGLLGCLTILPPGKLPQTNSTFSFPQVRLGYRQALKSPAFINYALVRAISNSAAFCFTTASPFVFTQLYTLGKEQLGFLYSAFASGIIVTGLLNTVLLKHFPLQIITRTAVRIQVVAGLASLLIVYLDGPLALLLGVLFLMLSMLGLILPNTTALYLAAVPAHNGSASALVGAMSYFSAFLATALVNLLHNNTAYPMMLMMWGCTLAAYCCLRYRRSAGQARPGMSV